MTKFQIEVTSVEQGVQVAATLAKMGVEMQPITVAPMVADMKDGVLTMRPPSEASKSARPSVAKVKPAPQKPARATKKTKAPKVATPDRAAFIETVYAALGSTNGSKGAITTEVNKTVKATENQVFRALKALHGEGKAHMAGDKRWARWGRTKDEAQSRSNAASGVVGQPEPKTKAVKPVKRPARRVVPEPQAPGAEE